MSTFWSGVYLCGPCVFGSLRTVISTLTPIKKNETFVLNPKDLLPVLLVLLINLILGSYSWFPFWILGFFVLNKRLLFSLMILKLLHFLGFGLCFPQYISIWARYFHLSTTVVFLKGSPVPWNYDCLINYSLSTSLCPFALFSCPVVFSLILFPHHFGPLLALLLCLLLCPL